MLRSANVVWLGGERGVPAASHRTHSIVPTTPPPPPCRLHPVWCELHRHHVRFIPLRLLRLELLLPGALHCWDVLLMLRCSPDDSKPNMAPLVPKCS